MHKNASILIDRVTGVLGAPAENIHLIQRRERQIAIYAFHASRGIEIEGSLISTRDIAAH